MEAHGEGGVSEQDCDVLQELYAVVRQGLTEDLQRLRSQNHIFPGLIFGYSERCPCLSAAKHGKRKVIQWLRSQHPAGPWSDHALHNSS